MHKPDTRIIWTTVGAIPSGKVASYGQIAELAGFPRHARQVGRILRELPEGTKLPWHRVVRTNGEIAFPEGSVQREEQTARLRAEGIVVKGGRVAMRTFRWQPSV